MDEKEKTELRIVFASEINKGNPNKLSEIVRRVNELMAERRKKFGTRTMKRAAGAR